LPINARKRPEDVLGQTLLRRFGPDADLTATGAKFVKHAQILVHALAPGCGKRPIDWKN